jgi:hypothetical protein
MESQNDKIGFALPGFFAKFSPPAQTIFYWPSADRPAVCPGVCREYIKKVPALNEQELKIFSLMDLFTQ